MRTRSAQLTLALVLLLLGAMMMIQFRTQGRLASAKVAESASDQTTIIADLANANDELRVEAQSLAQQEADYQRSLAQNDLTGVTADLNRLRVITGETEVSGPGIELKVSYPIRAEDVQDLINEFRNARDGGARRERHSSGCEERGQYQPGPNGDNDKTLDLPLVFDAIGDPDTLDRALGRVGGMVSYLKTTYPSAQITMTKQSKLTLSPTAKRWDLQAADVVK